jgi:Fe-S cluster biogenesis protein NfuA
MSHGAVTPSARSAEAFRQQAEHLDALIAELEAGGDDRAQSAARELVQAVMNVHGIALERLIQTVAEQESGLLERLGDDPVVCSLLALHDMHPVPFATRVERGLEKARPYLRSHGGNVELIETDEYGNIRLRLHGTCRTCPASAVTLRDAVEVAVRDAAPEAEVISIEGEVGTDSGEAIPVLGDDEAARAARAARRTLPLAPIHATAH